MRSDLEVMRQYYEIVLKALKERKGNTPKEIVKNELKDDKAKLVETLLKSNGMLDLSRELYEMKKRSLNSNCFALEVKLVTPGLVGIGSGPFKAVFEVGLNLDPVLGLPYYPGSGIKGAVRSLVENYLDKGLVDKLFGDKERSSAIDFMDMYPIGLEGDSLFKGLVTNPHYYKGGELVENELEVNPVPVQHVGISEGTIFGLISCIKVERLEELKELLNPEKWKGKMKDLVEKIAKGNEPDSLKLVKLVALITIMTLKRGIAARSAKGYNYFEIFDRLKFEAKSLEVGR